MNYILSALIGVCIIGSLTVNEIDATRGVVDLAKQNVSAYNARIEADAQQINETCIEAGLSCRVLVGKENQENLLPDTSPIPASDPAQEVQP